MAHQSACHLLSDCTIAPINSLNHSSTVYKWLLLVDCVPLLPQQQLMLLGHTMLWGS